MKQFEKRVCVDEKEIDQGMEDTAQVAIVVVVVCCSSIDARADGGGGRGEVRGQYSGCWVVFGCKRADTYGMYSESQMRSEVNL